MMSHDWPNGVVNHGDKEELLRKKWHFEGKPFWYINTLQYICVATFVYSFQTKQLSIFIFYKHSIGDL